MHSDSGEFIMSKLLFLSNYPALQVHMLLPLSQLFGLCLRSYNGMKRSTLSLLNTHCKITVHLSLVKQELNVALLTVDHFCLPVLLMNGHPLYSQQHEAP